MERMERMYKHLMASVTPVTDEGGWEWEGIVGGTAASVGLFGLVQFLSERSLKRMVDSKAITMSTSHLEQGPSYVTSTVHALGISLWALSKISKTTNGGECRNCIPFTLGYFINDFIQDCVLHQHLDAATLAHHASAITLLSSGIHCPASAAVFLPHVYTTEISTIFLNAIWMMRACGKGSHKVFKPLMWTFALSFFLFRVLYYPFVMNGVYPKKQFTRAREWFSWRIYGMQIFVFLNFFWFAKLIKKMVQ